MKKNDLCLVKPILFFFVLLLPSVLFLMVSCSSSGGKLQSKDTDLGSPQRYSAKYYVDNNSYLDIDPIMLSRDMMNYTKSEDKDSLDVELAKVKAVFYRFYSNIAEDEDGNYYSKCKSAEELNISEELFKYLLGTLDERNAVVKDAKERGVELIVADITEEYLESLLK